MWSLGVILYILLCGYPPFYNENHTKLFAKITAGEYSFHDKYWKDISDEAKALIKGILVTNPKERLTGE